MNPLAVDIWIYIACGYVLVSLTIWIVARFSPFEWVPAKPQTKSAFVMPNTFDELSDEDQDHPGGNSAHEHIELVQKHHIINEQTIRDEKIEVEEEDENECLQPTLNVAIKTPPSTTTTKSADMLWPYNRLHLPATFLNMEVSNTIDTEKTTELLTISNDFTLKNCFWFAIGALMQQGSDLYPRVTFSLKIYNIIKLI